MVKVTVSRNIGLKVGEEHGKEIYDNIFFNIDVKAGSEVELSEKDLKKVRAAKTSFLKAQAILEKAVQGLG